MPLGCGSYGLLFRAYRIGQYSYLFHLDVDFIPVLEKNRRGSGETCTGRRTSYNDRTGQECGVLTQVADQLIDWEDHVGRVALLHNFAVQSRAYFKGLGIWYFIRRD